MGKIKKHKRKVKFVPADLRFLIAPSVVVDSTRDERGEVRFLHPSREDMAVTTNLAAAEKQAEKHVMTSSEEVSIYRLTHVVTYKRKVSVSVSKKK